MRKPGEGCQHLGQGIRGMGIIDKNRRPEVRFPPGRPHPLQPTRGAGRISQQGGYDLCLYSQGQSNAHDSLQVFHIKVTHQGRGNLNLFFRQTQSHGGGLQRRLDVHRKDVALIDPATLTYLSALSRTQLNQQPRPFLLFRIVIRRTGHNTPAALFQMITKEEGLGRKIVLHVLMIIQMITGKIGKGNHVKLEITKATLDQGMGGNLHDHMGHARLRHLAQEPLQQKRFRRCERGRQLDVPPFPITVTIIDRADDTDRQSQLP